MLTSHPTFDLYRVCVTRAPYSADDSNKQNRSCDSPTPTALTGHHRLFLCRTEHSLRLTCASQLWSNCLSIPFFYLYTPYPSLRFEVFLLLFFSGLGEHVSSNSTFFTTKDEALKEGVPITKLCNSSFVEFLSLAIKHPVLYQRRTDVRESGPSQSEWAFRLNPKDLVPNTPYRPPYLPIAVAFRGPQRPRTQN